MDASSLRALTVKELRSLADGQGVPRAARLKKDELVAALLPLLCPTPAAPMAAPASAPAGSSSIEAPAAAPAAPLPPPQDGLPIPDRYGCDRLVLMVQDPNHLFAYWEVSPAALDRARAAAGEGWAPVLVLHTAGGTEQREVDLRGGNYYLTVAANSDYRAVLAIRDRAGRLHLLAESTLVRTPAAAPSPSSEEQWMVVDETFSELLSLAGAPAGSSGALSSGARFRTRSLDSRILSWSEEQAGGAGGPGLPSSLTVARPGAAPSSAALAAGPGAPSSLQAGLPLSLSSGELLSSGALSSFSLSSSALSSSSGALVRAIERQLTAPAANGGHGQANAAIAAPGTALPPPTPPAPTAIPMSAAPVHAAPAAVGGDPGPGLPPLHRLRGVETIKREGRKPLPPKSR